MLQNLRRIRKVLECWLGNRGFDYSIFGTLDFWSVGFASGVLARYWMIRFSDEAETEYTDTAVPAVPEHTATADTERSRSERSRSGRR